MHRADSIIHTFRGEHFEVAVWRGVEPGTYDTLICSRPGSGVTVLKGMIECPPGPLHELEKLIKLAELLIEHLRDGKPFACWTHDPSRN